jgi:hypothetical protein
MRFLNRNGKKNGCIPPKYKGGGIRYYPQRIRCFAPGDNRDWVISLIKNQKTMRHGIFK